MGLLLALASCGAAGSRPSAGSGSSPSTSTDDTGDGDTHGSSVEGDATSADDADADDGSTVGDESGGSQPSSRVDGLDFHCKLINGTSVEDPSANHLHTRFNLRATDLGIPLVIGPSLHLFFGDTHGYREIWAIGEDPDSVALVDAEAAAADPSVMCTELSFYATADVPSVAADTDPTVQRDFAVGWMSPPPGEDIGAYVGHHPAPFPNIPGSFEVPTGALAIGDDVYTFWAGKSEFDPYARMTIGYLARWDAPREFPEYQIVRTIDALDDGALGGHFIQVLPFVDGDRLYLFGTGDYRRTGVHLARMPVSALENGAGQEVWDPGAGAWVDPAGLDASARAAIAPVVETGGVGELGGVFVPGPDVYLLMYQQATALGDELLSNRVVVRTAPAPTGPWSEQLVVIDMADPAFALQHCCLAEPCVGDQIWRCNEAGLYGAYPLPNPRVTPQEDGTFAVDLPFVVSTWLPYNVVLFEARLSLAPGAQ
jgi:hypothetical protein